MHANFAQAIAQLEPAFQALLAMGPAKPLALPTHVPASGVYLLSEGPKHLYVGRSKRIKKRLANHCRVGASHRMAAFAFRLAREATGNLAPTYKTAGSRAALMREPAFAAAFDAAKARIRNMEVRFVAEPDPVRQTLLEVYVGVALGTPYNDWDTH